jgi:hypothetical protein
VCAMRNCDPSGRLHEPVVVLLPPLPAATAPAPVKTRD